MQNKKLEKILVADDSEEYRERIAKILLKGYDVDFAANAEEAIKKAQENKYDLIITDNRMPVDKKGLIVNGHMCGYYKNDGIYVIENIRKFDKETPIILNTSELNIEIAIEAIQKGADYAIHKNQLSEFSDNYKNIINKCLKRTNSQP